MAGIAAADLFIMSGARGAAGITGHRVLHPAHMLEHALHTPEAAAGKNRCGLAGGGRFIERRWGDLHRRFGCEGNTLDQQDRQGQAGHCGDRQQRRGEFLLHHGFAHFMDPLGNQPKVKA